MRLPFAVVSALAYAQSIARPASEARPAPGAGSEPPIVEPWRSPGVPADADPIATFLLQGPVYPKAGAETRADTVFTLYQAWASSRGLGLPSRASFLTRLATYGHLYGAEGGIMVQGFATRVPELPPGDRLQFTTPARAIPGLRARIIADSALLAAELATALQSARDVLEAAADAPGATGDVVRIAASILDDALTDFGSSTPDRATA